MMKPSKSNFLDYKSYIQIIEDLHTSFKQDNYLGWDLYDALLSKFFVKGSIFDLYYPRYIWTQVNKRSPINLRPIMIVPKSLNPKGLALILRAYCALYEYNRNEMWLSSAQKVCDLLLAVKSDNEYYCWGSNFPYQSRGNYYEANDPGAVATSFCANAILELLRINGDAKLKTVLLSIRDFYLKQLLLVNDDKYTVFSYHIQDKNITYNATAKVGESLALISEYFNIEEDTKLLEGSLRYLFDNQNPNGSWYYSTGSSGKWIDNFHTGYVLVALKKLLGHSPEDRYGQLLQKGLSYHRVNHYLNGAIPKYYDTALYPIDTHCFAQSIITFTEFGDISFSRELLNTAIELMYDSKEKYFIYSIRKHYKVKTNLLRWCNAYMFWAIANYLRTFNKAG